MLDLDAILAGFPRQVPVFPLAEVVLFPGTVLPLHVFEPRYKEMVRDALAGDRLIAMALLQQCTKDEYRAAPPFHPTLCVGYLIHHEPLDDGRSNIALLGLSAGLAGDVRDDHPYRTTDVELLADRTDPGPGYEERVRTLLPRVAPGGGTLEGLRAQLEPLVKPELIPAALVNTCALTARLRPGDKLDLLEERDVAARLDRLLKLLERPWQWN